MTQPQRRLSLTILTVLALSATPSLSAQDSGPALTWQFYGDFDSDTVIPDSGKATWSLKQNHASLLISSRQGIPVSVLADVLHPTELFQFTVPLGTGHLTFGRVLVPFGTFDFHHLYGGRPDESGTFLPKLWSDIGVVYSPPVWGPLRADLFVTNGADPSGFSAADSTSRIYAVGSTDSNRAKAAGFRVRADLAPGFWIITSGSWDPYGTDDDLTRALAMGGLDAGLELSDWSFKAGGILQQILGDKPYQRWADYFEAKWKFDWTMALRFRSGQMDTNSLYITAEDQANFNVGLLWHLDLYEVDLMYFRNFTLADPAAVGRDHDYHQVLLKVLVAF